MNILTYFKGDIIDLFDCMGKYYILTVYSEIKWPIY